MMGNKIICLSFAALLSFSQLYPAFAAEDARVFDEANLFDEDDTKELENRIAEVRESENADLAVVTTDDAQGKTSEEYADDFYDSHGMGMGDDASGILLLIDMDNREIYISTSGYAARVLTDNRIEDVLDAAYDEVSDGYYADGALAAIDSIETYLELGVPDDQYSVVREDKKRSLEWYEVLIAAAVATIAGGLSCLGVVRKYKMKKERSRSLGFHMSYRADSTLNFIKNEERFVNRSVVTRRIPRKDGPGPSGGSAGRTTMHHSSSGNMHGGGGRKF